MATPGEEGAECRPMRRRRGDPRAPRLQQQVYRSVTVPPRQSTSCCIWYSAHVRASSLGRRVLHRLRNLFGSSVVLLPLLLLLLILVSMGRWRRHRAPLHPPPGRGYTILINTWKRNDLLKQSVVHYASCAGVDSIHIVWSEPHPPSDSLRTALKKAAHLNSNGRKDIELRFDLNQEDNLNNRFKEIKDLRTDAIFSIDDDVIFPCASVVFAFTVWQSAPTTMVGFVPRMHWLHKSRDSMHLYSYGGWWSVWWMGTYSMVLSKAAFLHKKYLDLYTNHMPGSLRDFIKKNRNCEDIAMAFLVANQTGAPPIWVKGRIYEIGSAGISSLGGHNERRSRCLNIFVEFYGRMPLVATNVKAIDSRNSWFW